MFQIKSKSSSSKPLVNDKCFMASPESRNLSFMFCTLGAASKKVVLLGGGGRGGGVEARPQLSAKKYHFLLLLPFDAEYPKEPRKKVKMLIFSLIF